MSDVATILARRVAVEFSDSDDCASESEYDSDDWGELSVRYYFLVFWLSYYRRDWCLTEESKQTVLSLIASNFIYIFTFCIFSREDHYSSSAEYNFLSSQEYFFKSQESLATVIDFVDEELETSKENVEDAADISSTQSSPRETRRKDVETGQRLTP